MLRIWGRLSSINVQKVVWCARELHLDHERIDIGNQKGELDTEAYVRLNPNRLIPVIEDFRDTDVAGEPFVLWESNAIVRYLCARYGEDTLWPSDVKARASADRWMDWQTTTFSPAMVQAFLQLVRTPADKRDESVTRPSSRNRASAPSRWRRCSTTRWKAASSSVAIASRWPTSRWPARRTAGWACQRPTRPGLTSSAGSRPCGRVRRPLASSNCR